MKEIYHWLQEGFSPETTPNAHIFFIKIPDTFPRWYYFGESKFLFEFQISMLFINFIIRTVAFIVNVVTINVIRINRKLHSPLNFLIASLCVVDALPLIYGITFVTYTVTIRISEQNFYVSNTGQHYKNEIYEATWLTVICYIATFISQASSLGNTSFKLRKYRSSQCYRFRKTVRCCQTYVLAIKNDQLFVIEDYHMYMDLYYC